MLCGQIQDVSTIEVHASNCSDRTYIEVYESDEHEDDERMEVVTNKDTVKHFKEDEVIPALKKVLKESIEISEDKVLLLKIKKESLFLGLLQQLREIVDQEQDWKSVPNQVLWAKW